MNRKILIVVTKAGWGGAQRHVFDLSVGLKKEGHEVFVATGVDSIDNLLIKKLKENSIDLKKIKFLVRKISFFKDVLAFFELFFYIKKQKFDVVHLHSSKAGIVGSISAKLAGCKRVVYTAHGFVFNEPMNSFKKLFYIYLEKISSLFRDKIIAVSEFDKKTAIKYKIISKNKIIVVHNGINKNNFGLDKNNARIKILNKLGLDLSLKNRIFIGSIANFYKTKGLDFFIESAKKVVLQKKDILFFVIGDGELRLKLEKKIKNLDLENNFFLLGHLDNAENYLSAFDIYLCSSLKEGFSYSLLEAVSAGLPIIATNVGGNSEIVKDKENGILINPKNSKELADAIFYLLNNSEIRESFQEQSRLFSQNKFKSTKMLNQIISIYNL